MVLDKKTSDEIIEFVRSQPRTVNDVAKLVDRNWRTADRYIKQIVKETGLIGVKTFRKGTRGALKIVYWNALEFATQSTMQDRLFQQILSGRYKEDFSPFDIFQFVDPEYRECISSSDEADVPPSKFLLNSKRQVLSFSGNLSWLSLYPEAFQSLETLARQGVDIKILVRVDVTSHKIVQNLLKINNTIGRDRIAVRHAQQPLRALVIDDSLASIKEVFSASNPAHKELSDDLVMFFRITDEDWVRWIQRVFWELWSVSIPARSRIEALQELSLPGD